MPQMATPLPRGEQVTQVSAGADGLYKEFPDVDYSASSNVKPRFSNARVMCRLAFNGHASAALAVSACVTYEAGADAQGDFDGFNQGAIDAVCGAGVNPAGVIDEYLTAALVAGSYCWMVVRGPTQCIDDGTASLSEFDVIVTAAGGDVVTSAAHERGECGMCIDAANVAANQIGRVNFTSTNWY